MAPPGLGPTKPAKAAPPRIRTEAAPEPGRLGSAVRAKISSEEKVAPTPKQQVEQMMNKGRVSERMLREHEECN
jgi:hypothetical protein